MARFKLSSTGSLRALGGLVVQVANAADKLRKGDELTDEQKAELSNQYRGDFQALIEGKQVNIVFDEKHSVNVVIPDFHGEIKTGYDLDSIAEECLGNIVMAGCCQ